MALAEGVTGSDITPALVGGRAERTPLAHLLLELRHATGVSRAERLEQRAVRIQQQRHVERPQRRILLPHRRGGALGQRTPVPRDN